MAIPGALLPASSHRVAGHLFGRHPLQQGVQDFCLMLGTPITAGQTDRRWAEVSQTS